MTKGLKRARLVLKTAAELSRSEKEELFALWKANMGHYAQLEYTDRGKWDEMYDVDARYLVIRRQGDAPSGSGSPLARTLKLGSGQGRSRSRSQEEKEREGDDGGERKRRRMRRKSERTDEGELLGFASFRFDTEETMSPRDAEVVYW